MADNDDDLGLDDDLFAIPPLEPEAPDAGSSAGGALDQGLMDELDAMFEDASDDDMVVEADDLSGFNAAPADEDPFADLLDDTVGDTSYDDDFDDELVGEPPEDVAVASSAGDAGIESDFVVEDDFPPTDDVPFLAEPDEPALTPPQASGVDIAAAATLVGAAVAAQVSKPTEENSMAKSAANQAADEPIDVNPLHIIAALGVLVVAFVLGGIATILVFGARSDLAAIDQRVGALELRPGAAVGGGGQDPRLDGLAQRVNAISNQLGELAIIIEGPMSHLQQSTEQTYGELSARLEKLEQQLPALKAGATAKSLVKPAAKAAAPTNAGGGQGGWVVNLLSLTNEASTDQQLARIRDMGINAVKASFQKNGRTWYRVQVTGFTSYEAAKAEAARIKGKGGLDSPWVAKAEP